MAESLQSPPVLTEDLADIFLETVVEEDVPIEPSPLLDLEPEEVFANARQGDTRCREFVDLTG